MVYTRFAILPLSLVLLVSAGPIPRAAFSQQNGIDAQALNAKFATLTTSSPCSAGDFACIDGGFAQCVGSSFVVQPCSASLQCFALPLVNKPGTTVTCTSESDALARIAASGATGGITGNGSTSADPSSGDDSSASTPAPASTPASSGAGTVTVAVGDTCIAIAQANGVDVGALMAANPDVNSGCTNLQIGQTLTLPDSSDSSTPASTDPPAASSTPATSSDAGGAAPAACENKRKRSINPGLGLVKRIAQADLPAVAQSWQNLCLVSGGDITTNEPCVQLAGINGINSLLAGADPCAQQNNADAMIDFAKSPGIVNQAALIANAIAYRQHPRNALNINGIVPSTPFCQTAPRNAELNGIVNGQLDGVDPGLFGGPNFAIVPFGDPVSCPFGQTPDVATCTCS